VLPNLYRFLGSPSESAPRGRDAGDGVGLQRLAHRRMGGLIPGSLHSDRRASDVEPRGDVRRDPQGRRQGLPRGDHARTSASRACRATTTATTGARCGERCRKKMW
jgi:hypothetical protein